MCRGREGREGAWPDKGGYRKPHSEWEQCAWDVHPTGTRDAHRITSRRLRLVGRRPVLSLLTALTRAVGGRPAGQTGPAFTERTS